MLSEAVDGEGEYGRCIVRLLRVLGLGEDIVVRRIQKDEAFVRVLTRMAVEGMDRGENGKEVVKGATSLVNRISYSQN